MRRVIQPEIVPELRNVIFLSILVLYIFDKTTDDMLNKTKMLICLVLRNFFKICCRNFFREKGFLIILSVNFSGRHVTLLPNLKTR